MQKKQQQKMWSLTSCVVMMKIYSEGGQFQYLAADSHLFYLQTYVFSPVFGTRRGPSFVPGSKQNIVVGIFSFIHLMAIMWLPPHREVTSCLAL